MTAVDISRSYAAAVLLHPSLSENIKYIYIQNTYFYSLKHNNSFILYLKLHKIRATSFGILPSSDPSQNQRISLKN